MKIDIEDIEDDGVGFESEFVLSSATNWTHAPIVRIARTRSFSTLPIRARSGAEGERERR